MGSERIDNHFTVFNSARGSDRFSDELPFLGEDMRYGFYGFKPYVPVAKRRANAAKEVKKILKRGTVPEPISLQSKVIASSFWGKSWCENIESYRDMENRIERGRTYVRNGSVVHLTISPGVVDALVAGSSLYKVKVKIAALAANKWSGIKKACVGSIGSLVELLQGKLSKDVMQLVSNKEQGLFPKLKEIEMSCSCPDYATVCKHVAAVLYGVGSRLDNSPELLFKLRQVDHIELLDVSKSGMKAQAGKGTLSGDLGDMFGIELSNEGEGATSRVSSKIKAVSQVNKRDKGKKVVKVSRAGSVKKVSVKKVSAKKVSAEKVSAKNSVAKRGVKSRASGVKPAVRRVGRDKAATLGAATNRSRKAKAH